MRKRREGANGVSVVTDTANRLRSQAEDAVNLRRKLNRSLRMQKVRALLLIAPLLIFILISFLFPIADMLFRSVENKIVSQVLPRTVASLQSWDPANSDLPNEATFRSIYADLAIAVEQRRNTRVGTRLNYESPGIASLFRKVKRGMTKIDVSSFINFFNDLDPNFRDSEWLAREFSKPALAKLLPFSASALEYWRVENPEGGQPDSYLYVSLAVELISASKAGLGELERPIADFLVKAQEQLPRLDHVNLRDAFLEIDRKWGEPTVWRTIKMYSPTLTTGYLLNSIDMKKGLDGPEFRDDSERLYIKIFIRTLVMSLTITLCSLLLGYPVAYFLAHQPLRRANLYLILVLLPFWTSLLVRTSAWKVLLQQEGVINDFMVVLRIIDDSGRLIMINNQFGTIVAMTHILLPFMILPLFSVMKTIPESYVRAAKSLGASSWTAFRRIYFPQTMAGIGAGSVLVFILAIGYYITPELVGGTKGTFISNRIAYHISSSLNWGLAAALASLLFGAVLVLYWVYDRIVGIDNVKLG